MEPSSETQFGFRVLGPTSDQAQHFLRIRVSYRKELMPKTQKENSIAAGRFSNTSKGQHKSLQGEL